MLYVMFMYVYVYLEESQSLYLTDTPRTCTRKNPLIRVCLRLINETDKKKMI